MLGAYSGQKYKVFFNWVVQGQGMPGFIHGVVPHARTCIMGPMGGVLKHMLHGFDGQGYADICGLLLWWLTIGTAKPRLNGLNGSVRFRF